jgi:hypothetical protein
MKCLNCGAEILTNTCVLCGTTLTPEQEGILDAQVDELNEKQYHAHFRR